MGMRQSVQQMPEDRVRLTADSSATPPWSGFCPVLLGGFLVTAIAMAPTALFAGGSAGPSPRGAGLAVRRRVDRTSHFQPLDREDPARVDGVAPRATLTVGSGPPPGKCRGREVAMTTAPASCEVFCWIHKAGLARPTGGRHARWFEHRAEGRRRPARRRLLRPGPQGPFTRQGHGIGGVGHGKAWHAPFNWRYSRRPPPVSSLLLSNPSGIATIARRDAARACQLTSAPGDSVVQRR